MPQFYTLTSYFRFCFFLFSLDTGATTTKRTSTAFKYRNLVVSAVQRKLYIDCCKVHKSQTVFEVTPDSLFCIPCRCPLKNNTPNFMKRYCALQPSPKIGRKPFHILFFGDNKQQQYKFIRLIISKTQHFCAQKTSRCNQKK